MNFYVYEHWRPDLDIPFYVGKGSGDRYRSSKTRNQHHTRVKAKLKKLGMCVEVRMVSHGLTENEALLAEVERIAFWKSIGVELTNITSGGDGLRNPTQETINKMKASSKKRWANPENKKLHAEKTKAGMQTFEVLYKVGKALRGKRMSDEHKKKISDALTKKKKSPEHIVKVANQQIGNKYAIGNKNRLGQKVSEETKEKMSKSQSMRRFREKENA